MKPTTENVRATENEKTNEKQNQVARKDKNKKLKEHKQNNKIPRKESGEHANKKETQEVRRLFGSVAVDV